jgi:hypothetical protein
MANYYQQVRKYRDVPYTGGLCLKATQDAFSPPDNFQKQAYAMAAWDMETRSGAAKTSLPPSGVAVPIWFDLTALGNDRTTRGHIAISLANGKVASASLGGYHTNLYIHNNISDLMKYYGQGIKYLGWSSWLEGVQIVKTIAAPEGYIAVSNPRHGAVYKKDDNVIFCCDKGTKGGVIKFLYYKGKEFRAKSTVKLTSDHATVPLDNPRSGAKVKFGRMSQVGFSPDLTPKFIYQSGVDWTP